MKEGEEWERRMRGRGGRGGVGIKETWFDKEQKQFYKNKKHTHTSSVYVHMIRTWAILNSRKPWLEFYHKDPKSSNEQLGAVRSSKERGVRAVKAGPGSTESCSGSQEHTQNFSLTSISSF